MLIDRVDAGVLPRSRWVGPAKARPALTPWSHQEAATAQELAPESVELSAAPPAGRCPDSLGAHRPRGAPHIFLAVQTKPSSLPFPSSSPEILPTRRGRLYETEGSADTASEAMGLPDALGPALPGDPRWAPRHPTRVLCPLSPQTLMHRLQGSPGPKP